MDGQVKIGDFGLVTALEENCEYTPVCDNPAGYSKHTDQVGTKLYMSPEQVHKMLMISYCFIQMYNSSMN